MLNGFLRSIGKLHVPIVFQDLSSIQGLEIHIPYSGSVVSPVADKLGNHFRIGQGRCVTQIGDVSGRDFGENAAYDLA
jgi:hypothetical protein